MFQMVSLDGVVRLSDRLFYEKPGAVLFVVIFVMVWMSERERGKRETETEKERQRDRETETETETERERQHDWTEGKRGAGRDT
jgi:hypothetical protein